MNLHSIEDINKQVTVMIEKNTFENCSQGEKFISAYNIKEL